MPSDGASLLHTHDKTTAFPSPSSKKFHKRVSSPKMQDKSTPTDLTSRRRVAPLNAPNHLEISAKQGDLYNSSVDSSSDSGSDQAFKPEEAFNESDGTSRSESQPRKAQPDVSVEVRTRRSTRIAPSHKLVDWSSESESDGGATLVPWKGNRGVCVSPPTPGPSNREGKRPRGRPRKYGSSKSFGTI